MNVTAPSDEVVAKIREQIEACAFPAPLKAEEWDCGDVAWLLDVIAPTKEQATAVVKDFGQVVKEGEMLVHPGISALIGASRSSQTQENSSYSMMKDAMP